MNKHKYRQYGKKQIRLPYDVDSPFGTYRPAKSKETLFRLFQNRALPRNFIYKAFLKSANKRQKDGIFDVTVAGIDVRLCPEVSGSDNKFLRKGKYVDFTEWTALANACRSAENPVFVDIGANIGMYSLLLAKEIPELHVFAIEPHPGICHQLKFNCSLNPNFKINVCGYAISDLRGQVNMNTGENEISVSRIDDTGDLTVDCITLVDFVERENLSCIHALKVDVEGYEDRVLVPYLKSTSDEMLPNTIVVEVITSEHWLEDPIEMAISRGYTEVKRNKMNSILVLQK